MTTLPAPTVRTFDVPLPLVLSADVRAALRVVSEQRFEQVTQTSPTLLRVESRSAFHESDLAFVRSSLGNHAQMRAFDVRNGVRDVYGDRLR